MKETNIDIFNVIVVNLFEQLYREFPLAINVPMIDPDCKSTDTRVRKIYEDSVLFLAREGFIIIRLANYTNSTFEGVVLTSKGLSVLNSSPDALETKLTIGESLTEITKNGVKEAYTTLVGTIINAGLSSN